MRPPAIRHWPGQPAPFGDLASRSRKASSLGSGFRLSWADGANRYLEVCTCRRDFVPMRGLRPGVPSGGGHLAAHCWRRCGLQRPDGRRLQGGTGRPARVRPCHRPDPRGARFGPVGAEEPGARATRLPAGRRAYPVQRAPVAASQATRIAGRCGLGTRRADRSEPCCRGGRAGREHRDRTGQRCAGAYRRGRKRSADLGRDRGAAVSAALAITPAARMSVTPAASYARVPAGGPITAPASAGPASARARRDQRDRTRAAARRAQPPARWCPARAPESPRQAQLLRPEARRARPLASPAAAGPLADQAAQPGLPGAAGARGAT